MVDFRSLLLHRSRAALLHDAKGRRSPENHGESESGLQSQYTLPLSIGCGDECFGDTNIGDSGWFVLVVVERNWDPVLLPTFP